MTYVSEPFPGYRLKKEFTHLISENPPNSGRLFRDPNGRPSGNILSALYLGCGPKYYDACQACTRAEQYPGRLVTTSFGSDFHPHRLYEQMTETERASKSTD